MKLIKPGTPEFDAIKDQITPLHKIRHPRPRLILPFGGESVAKPKTRRESPDKMR